MGTRMRLVRVVVTVVVALIGLYGAAYAMTPFHYWAGMNCRAPVLAALPGDRDLDNCVELARDRLRRSGAVLGLDAAGALTMWAVMGLRRRAGGSRGSRKTSRSERSREVAPDRALATAVTDCRS
jgi:hypothetical protein